MDLKKLEIMAEEAAGNFLDFKNYLRYTPFIEKDEEGDWTVHYTPIDNLMNRSNSAIIEAELKSFEKSGDVEFGSDSHFVVGKINNVWVRVYRKDKITKAFKVLAEMLDRMRNYPLLDEEDYSQRETEATVENISGEISSAIRQENVQEIKSTDDSTAYDVLRWLYDNGFEDELENRDDQGGYPSEEAILTALEAMGYVSVMREYYPGSVVGVYRYGHIEEAQIMFREDDRYAVRFQDGSEEMLPWQDITIAPGISAVPGQLAFRDFLVNNPIQLSRASGQGPAMVDKYIDKILTILSPTLDSRGYHKLVSRTLEQLARRLRVAPDDDYLLRALQDCILDGMVVEKNGQFTRVA